MQPSKGAEELFLDLDAVLADAEADADAGGSGDQMLFSMDGSDADGAYEKDAIDESIDRLAQAMQLKDFDDEGDGMACGARRRGARGRREGRLLWCALHQSCTRSRRMASCAA